LKPDNVIVIQQRGSDFVKILDFGVAKFAKLAGRITADGAVFGTPHYMAPEQALGGDVDCRADVYSLGIILYELVTGTLPFDAESPYRVMEQHVTVAPVPPSQRVPLTRPIPACLEALILKCMAKSPDQRFADMRDLIQELERAQREVSPEATFAVRPPARIDSMPTVAERRERLSDCASLVPSHGTTEPPLWDESTTRGTVHDTGKTEGAARRRASLRRVLFAAILASAGLATLVRLSGLSDQVTAAAAPEFARQGPNVSVAVVLAPIDASIYEGSVNLGPMPLTVPVSPGRPRVLEARRPGFDPKRFVLDGSTTRVEIELRPTRGRLTRSP
jgi:serine/threonine protein kinase